MMTQAWAYSDCGEVKEAFCFLLLDSLGSLFSFRSCSSLFFLLWKGSAMLVSFNLEAVGDVRFVLWCVSRRLMASNKLVLAVDSAHFSFHQAFPLLGLVFGVLVSSVSHFSRWLVFCFKANCLLSGYVTSHSLPRDGFLKAHQSF